MYRKFERVGKGYLAAIPRAQQAKSVFCKMPFDPLRQAEEFR